MSIAIDDVAREITRATTLDQIIADLDEYALRLCLSGRREKAVGVEEARRLVMEFRNGKLTGETACLECADLQRKVNDLEFKIDCAMDALE